jgi:outer membrane lipoprotein SlyB
MTMTSNFSNPTMNMTSISSGALGIRRLATVLFAGFALLLAACSSPPAFQVSEQPAVRLGTVESIIQDQVQAGNTAMGTIGGALLGGLIGNQIGGGSGQTAATIVGAAGGSVAGNRAAQNTSVVWRIGVRYDDGTLATIQQTATPALRIGDRVRVTSTGIELLR